MKVSNKTQLRYVQGATVRTKARQKAPARALPRRPQASQNAVTGAKKSAASRVRVARPQRTPAAVAAAGLPEPSEASRRSNAHQTKTRNRVSDQKCTENQMSSGVKA